MTMIDLMSRVFSVSCRYAPLSAYGVPDDELITLCSRSGSIPKDFPNAKPSAKPIWLIANIKLT